MKGVILHEFDQGRLVRTSLAKQGLWKNGEWWIEDGQVFEVSEKGVVRLLFRFERQKLSLNLSPQQLQRRTKRPVDMSARELWLPWPPKECNPNARVHWAIRRRAVSLMEFRADVFHVFEEMQRR